MKKIRDVFYLAAAHSKKPWKGHVKEKLISAGISYWTGFLAVVSFDFKRLKFDFVHQEKWFPDGNGDFGKWIPGLVSDGEWTFTGICFSSTTRGDYKGVRFAPASEVLKHPERWHVCEREVLDWQYNKMLKAAEGEVGKKYDYVGLATGFFAFAWYLQNNIKWYCSEICAWLDWVVGLLKKRLWIISPRRAASLLVKVGNKIKPLKEGGSK